MELVDSERFLRTRLTGSAALMALVEGVHRHPAPADAEYPLITYEQQDGGADLMTVNGTRVMVRTIYLVRVIGKEVGPEDLEAAADLIDTLLHQYQNPTASSGVLSCVRNQPFEMIEVENLVEYTHLGGLYELTVR